MPGHRHMPSGDPSQWPSAITEIWEALKPFRAVQAAGEARGLSPGELVGLVSREDWTRLADLSPLAMPPAEDRVLAATREILENLIEWVDGLPYETREDETYASVSSASLRIAEVFGRLGPERQEAEIAASEHRRQPTAGDHPGPERLQSGVEVRPDLSNTQHAEEVLWLPPSLAAEYLVPPIEQVETGEGRHVSRVPTREFHVLREVLDRLSCARGREVPLIRASPAVAGG